jgi:hypothetical protein
MMTMKTGFVQMPLERYDELMRMMNILDNIVKIEADWNNEPTLKIDFSGLAARLSEKFEQSEFAGKWIMKDMSDYKETVWGVFKKIDADENQA